MNPLQQKPPMQRPTLTPHAASQQTALPAFSWFDEPLVIETEGESAWAAWDAVVREQDRNTPDGRAARLAGDIA